MAVTYDQAPAEVHEMAREILEEHHPELKLGESEHVRLCILMAQVTGDDVDPDEPAVKWNGYPALAVISVISYKQRVDKRADAEIIIDRKAWDDMTEPKQRALLDHEITHLEIQTDADGFVKSDDQGRPKLKLRLHDWQLGGFRSIAQRYGGDAVEVVEARKFEQDYADVTTAKAEGTMKMFG